MTARYIQTQNPKRPLSVTVLGLPMLAMMLAFAACGTPADGSDGGLRADGSAGCGPDSCTGCCLSGRCLPGGSGAACGLGGGACETCALDDVCSATGCETPPASCNADNCEGCCQGDECLAGDTLTMCGASGQACAQCETFQECDRGACGVIAASQWRVALLSATLPAVDFDGDDWDSLTAGEADAFVELRVGGATTEPIRLATVDDTLTPDWTEGGVSTAMSIPLRGDDLRDYLRFDMFDEDLSAHDQVGRCRYLGAEEAFDGEVVTLVCERSETLMHAGYTLRWQLVPVP